MMDVTQISEVALEAAARELYRLSGAKVPWERATSSVKGRHRHRAQRALLVGLTAWPDVRIFPEAAPLQAEHGFRITLPMPATGAAR